MKKSKLYGIVGSSLSCIILFLILWLVVMPSTITELKEDKGLMISFGNNSNGAGKSLMPANKPQLEKQIASKPTLTKQVLITQKNNSVAISERNEKIQKNKFALELQQKEINKRATENNRKEQLAIENASTVNGLFGNSTSTGSGTDSGNNQQGNPAGKGSSCGNSWSLNGRSLSGQLVSPSYDKDVEGKVTVNIRVDESGRVSSASVGSPTTISDAQTRNAALSAAKSTHFSGGKGASSGTITYNFKLK